VRPASNHPHPPTAIRLVMTRGRILLISLRAALVSVLAAGLGAGIASAAEKTWPIEQAKKPEAAAPHKPAAKAPQEPAAKHSAKPPAVEIGSEKLYKDCMREAAKHPNAAFERALAWQVTGGGFPARHCAASALQAMGQHGEAANRLEKLGEDMKAAPGPLRARVFRQASESWLSIGQRKRALVALDNAVMLDPDNERLLAERGLVRAVAGQLKEALADFDAALKKAPRDADVLVLRAATHRKLKQNDDAAADLKAALEIHPDHPDALLERGLLKVVLHDIKGARADWVRILQVAPKSRAADVARAKLAQLDVKLK
jgi:tetratricopeptide (TPR) repeat protein